MKGGAEGRCDPGRQGGARTSGAAAVARPRPGDRTRTGRSRRSRWQLGTPFVLLNAAALAAVFVHWSWTALTLGAVSYVVRAFGITAFYHRCFAHRAFRVPRAVQFAGALLGAAAAQRGPLWWAAHHREHHLYTDRPGDPHSPVVDGFWYSHVLWIFDPANAATRYSRVEDLARFPELAMLDRFEYAAPGAMLAGCAVFGALSAPAAPLAGASNMVVWGFVLPTVLLYHSTFAVNSLAHRFGSRRFDTRDDSRNNWLISALVLGEGWHNNHHRFPNSARQGLARRELDLTWWGIRLMAALGIAGAVRQPPTWAMAAARTRKSAPPSATGNRAISSGPAERTGRTNPVGRPGTPVAQPEDVREPLASSSTAASSSSARRPL